MEMPEPEQFSKPLGLLTKLACLLAAVDQETLRLAPRRDRQNVVATAALLSGAFVIEGSLITLVGHSVYSHDTFNPIIAAASAGISGFVMLLDSQMIISSYWHLAGIAELRRGGLDISGGLSSRVKVWALGTVRFAISLGLAGLIGTFVGETIAGKDIDLWLETKYRNANERIVAAAATRVDDAIVRATDAVRQQAIRVDAVSKQLAQVRDLEIDPSKCDAAVSELQSEIGALIKDKENVQAEAERLSSYSIDEKAGIKDGNDTHSGQQGKGVRFRAAQEKLAAAKARAVEIDRSIETDRKKLDDLRAKSASQCDAARQRSDAQAPQFEAALAAENQRLAQLQEELARVTEGREEAIRKSIEADSSYVKPDKAFVARFRALKAIIDSDPDTKWLILTFEWVAGAMELGALLGKIAAFNPTTYSALLARDVYMRLVRIVDGMERELNQSKARRNRDAEVFPEDMPSNDNQAPTPGAGPGMFGVPENPPPPPPKPKRGRGRPRKLPPLQ